MPFGHKAGLPPSKKYLLVRQPHFLQKTCIFVRSWEGAEQLWIGQDRILHLDQLKRHLSCAQHLRFAAMAGEDDDLTAVGGGKPFESCFQAIIIVLGKAVVEDQRKTSGFGAGPREKLCGSKAQGEIDLVHGSAADVFERDELCLRVQEDVQILVDAHAVVDPAGDAGDILGRLFVQIESERIPDRGGEVCHGLLGEVDGDDLIVDAVILRESPL